MTTTCTQSTSGIYTEESARWRALVGLAGAESGYIPSVRVEDYLVRLCLAYTARMKTRPPTQLFGHLVELFACGNADRARMPEIGDQALIVCGLFPEFTERLVAPIECVVAAGSGAYEMCSRGDDLQHELGRQFLPLVELLQQLRDLDSPPLGVDPLVAVALWNCSHSANSYRRVTQSLGAVSLGPVSGAVH